MWKEKEKIIINIIETGLDLIFPQVCGICGKLNKKSLCKKCENQLNKTAEFKTLDKKESNLNDKYFNELIYIFNYEGIIRKTILDYKFNQKSYLYKTFVNFILKNKNIFEKIKNYDKIIPVPISKKRMKERGYNQSFLIAKQIAKNINYYKNIEICNNVLIKVKNITEQSKLNKQDRLKNIQDVYKLKNKELINNKKILLVDDIYTTGSTVNECSKILLDANPKEIGVLVIAKD